jgi:hypothetical protein
MGGDVIFLPLEAADLRHAYSIAATITKMAPSLETKVEQESKLYTNIRSAQGETIVVWSSIWYAPTYSHSLHVAVYHRCP